MTPQPINPAKAWLYAGGAIMLTVVFGAIIWEWVLEQNERLKRYRQPDGLDRHVWKIHETLECARNNFDNLCKQNPHIEAHPIYILARQQLDDATEALWNQVWKDTNSGRSR